jgi:hypothetical protein
MGKLVFLLLACSTVGCYQDQDAQDSVTTAGWLDVSYNHARYYGLYMTISSGPDLAEASGVVLVPWDNRPDVGISVRKGETCLKFNGMERVYPGRQLLVLRPGAVSPHVVARDNDLALYTSRERLTLAIVHLLESEVGQRD